MIVAEDLSQGSCHPEGVMFLKYIEFKFLFKRTKEFKFMETVQLQVQFDSRTFGFQDFDSYPERMGMFYLHLSRLGELDSRKTKLNWTFL